MTFPDAYVRILRSGRPLTEINPGSSEVALTRDAALAAVEALADTQIGILGGDVLVDDNGRLRYAYAHWHSDPSAHETAAQFAHRSQRETAKYIRRYPSHRGPEPLFVLVCTVPQRLTTIPCRLLLTVTDVDRDYLRLEISIADGEFAGQVDVYEDLELPRTLAAALRGFPRSPTDRREIVLGSFDPRTAGGGVRVVFRCIDRSGHAIVEAELEDQPMDGTPRRSVQLRMPVTAPAIDTFVADMNTWSPQLGDRRLLSGA